MWGGGGRWGGLSATGKMRRRPAGQETACFPRPQDGARPCSTFTGVDPALTDTSSRVESLTGAALTKLLTDKERAFDQRFEKV